MPVSPVTPHLPVELSIIAVAPAVLGLCFTAHRFIQAFRSDSPPPLLERVRIELSFLGTATGLVSWIHFAGLAALGIVAPVALGCALSCGFVVSVVGIFQIVRALCQQGCRKADDTTKGLIFRLVRSILSVALVVLAGVSLILGAPVLPILQMVILLVVLVMILAPVVKKCCAISSHILRGMPHPVRSQDVVS